jgi:hypothetical protein
MTKRKRLIFFVSYLLVGLLTEAFIFYLFPYTGLGGLICYPTSIIISLVLGWTIYKLTKKELKLVYTIIIFITLLTIQFYIELFVHPQDFGGDPISQITAFNSASKKYDSITFDNFSSLNEAEKVAYIYKFKSILPQSITILNIDRESKIANYEIYNYANGKTIFDTTKLKLIYTDTSTIIIETLKDKTILTSIVPDKNLMSNISGGYFDREKSTYYTVSKNTFELKTGIEKLFYSYLSLTKKASRQH